MAYYHQPMKCRACGEQINPSVSEVEMPLTASKYSDCYYKCSCGAGFSNAQNPKQRHLIWPTPQQNVPSEVHEGLDEVLASALNELNRTIKREKFAFETSEDAVTWTVFCYLWGRLSIGEALGIERFEPTGLWFWGTRWPVNRQDEDLRPILEKLLLEGFHEDKKSMSEPDVIFETADQLVFVEVKYRSLNDKRPNYRGFPPYLNGNGINFVVGSNEVVTAGFYELTRNWVIGSALARIRDKHFILVNLAGEHCRQSADEFKRMLIQGPQKQFQFVAWRELLSRIPEPLDAWFQNYTKFRRISE
jgi:hypothetical protein